MKSIVKRHEFNLKKQMDTGRRIEQTISELRALIDASRISVLRFHNGSEFLPNNPIWKVTSENQVCADGITDEAIEGVLISRIQPLIEPLITGETNEPGVLYPEFCSRCTHREICRKLKSLTVKFSVEDMSGYTKIFLKKRGTKTAYLSALVNNENKVFGVLMIEYSDAIEKIKFEAEIMETACSYTEKLRFLFN